MIDFENIYPNQFISMQYLGHCHKELIAKNGQLESAIILWIPRKWNEFLENRVI